MSLDWISYMIIDTECLITATKGKVRTAQEIWADAKARPGAPMILAKLKAFQAVARLGSFTRAAVSLQIKDLENERGTLPEQPFIRDEVVG